MSEITDYLNQRDKALAELDIEWARSNISGNADDDVLLMSLHKARVEVVTLDETLRRESMEWLKARGLGRMHPSLEWPSNNRLPQ